MVACQENNQNSMSWTNRALIKHLVHSIHTCMSKIYSIHDISPIFMFYNKIFIRTTYKNTEINLDNLSKSLKAIYCLNNEGIINYANKIDVSIMSKNILDWDGIDPLGVYVEIHIPNDEISSVLEKFPDIKFMSYDDNSACIFQRYELLIANNIGITKVKAAIINDYLDNLAYINTVNIERLDTIGSLLGSFINHFYEYFNNMIINIAELGNCYVDYVDNGHIGMTINNELAYKVIELNETLSSEIFVFKMNTCKIIKIDTSNLPDIKSNTKASSVFFSKMIRTIAICASNLEHFEINYINEMDHILYLDNDTLKDMNIIFSRCKVILIRSKFDFGFNFWGINLSSFPKLVRFEFDNINDIKKIRINSTNTNVKHISLSNNVIPFDWHSELSILELHSMTISTDTIRMLPYTLHKINLMVQITSNLLFDISKFPCLCDLTLIGYSKSNHIINMFCSSENRQLKHLKFNDKVIMGFIDVPNLKQIAMDVNTITQETIDNIPHNIEDLSIQGNVSGKPIIDVTKFPHLGLLHLMNNIDKKFTLIGKMIHTVIGIFLVL